MNKLVLTLASLACAGHAEDPQKSLASLLVASSPSTAFNPSGLTSPLPARSRFGQQAPHMSMSRGRKQEKMRNQLLAGAIAAALAANPQAANAVAASMDEANAGPSPEQLQLEATISQETIEDTIARRFGEDRALYGIPLLILLGIGASFSQWSGASPDNEDDFFDIYDSRRVEAEDVQGEEAGGGKFFDKRVQTVFSDQKAENLGTDLGGGVFERKRNQKRSKAAEKAAKDASKRR